MTSEASIQAKIRIALGRLPDVRLFRNNRGMFWQGRSIGSAASTVTLANPRRIECGLVNGASDLIGITSITITPEMVGTRVAVFTAIEVKTGTGNATADQIRFIDYVRDAGGRAGIVRTTDDAFRLVQS